MTATVRQGEFKPFSLPEMTEDEQAELTRKVLACKAYESKPWEKFKITDVLEPRQNRLVQLNQYWVVTPDNCVLAFNSTLQCNPDEKLAEMLRAAVHRYCTLQKFDALFIPLKFWELQ